MTDRVIVEAMLVVMTVSLFVGVLTFQAQTQGPIQSALLSSIFNSKNAMKEGLLVEEVQFLSGNQIKVTVYNYGQISSTVSSVYVNNVALSAPPTNTINVNQSQAFTFTLSWTSGTAYHVKVVTSRGVPFEGIFSA